MALELRSDVWTADMMPAGYHSQLCAIVPFDKFRELLSQDKLFNVGTAKREFKVVSNGENDLFLRIEGGLGILLVPIQAKREDY